MRILVSGSSGFIASYLLPKLGHCVVTLMDKKTSQRNDITRYSNLTKKPRCTAVIHLAALCSVPESLLDPCGYLETNVQGTVNLLEYARLNDVEVFVYASSAAVYQPDMNPYAFSKYEAEVQCTLYQRLYGLNVKIARIFNAYGKGNRKGVIYRFTERIRQGLPLQVVGNGTQTRDYIHASDVADALVALLNSNGQGTVEVGTGIGTSINQLTELFNKVYGRKLPVEYLPPLEGDVATSTAKNPVVKNNISLLDGLKQCCSTS